MWEEKFPVCLDAVSGWDEILGVFDDLLDKAHVVGTPGSGFGKTVKVFPPHGFGTKANTAEAMERIRMVLWQIV